MKAYGVNELRRMFLHFFETKEHLVKSSYSLVPHNDKSILLINAGMAPLKPYFTGLEIPPKRRMATCQKCVRTGDIENVGKTARHLTFFEMLGNFSFGDYFKHEAIAWSWEFLTKVIGLEEDRLYPSVYGEDEEAFRIWVDEIGVAPERITKFYRDENGDCDNFWEHGAGPCGPCSEIYYDRGEKYGCGEPDCRVGCECDRYMEVWNNVFTQFNSDGHGNYTELENKNIDTGMGLERLAVVVQDVNSVFDIDTMKAIRDKVCSLSGKTYRTDQSDDVSIRLITDHIRSSVFMISDGITPSNEGRGYVLRRLIRRAARHGRMLGIDHLFLAELSDTVIEECKDGYPELEERKEFIFKVLTTEEESFNKTIDQGLEILAQMKTELKQSGEKVLSGENAFKLYDTYGFPIDLTQEILEDDGYTYDCDGFEAAMEVQRKKARGARKTMNYMGADATVYLEIDPAVTTEFVGYTDLNCKSDIIVLTTDTEIVTELHEGELGTIITEKTPFYATMGGQTADTGVIKTESGEFQVEDVISLLGGKIGHVGHVSTGIIRVKDEAEMEVDGKRHWRIARNHSATHLLHKALRDVLGTHVAQKGSDVNPDRLRFDFTHFSPMTKEEIKKVETIVNEQIEAWLPVHTDIMSMDEAKKTGAMALFDEKYGEKVRVVSMGNFSTELCGGTHVANTGSIAAFQIVSESGVASGVRRIEALTSVGLFEYLQKKENILKGAAAALKATPEEVVEKILHLQTENKEIASELESVKSKNAQASLGNAMDAVEEVSGVKLLALSVEDVENHALRDLGDQLKSDIGEGVVVLASVHNGKVGLVVMATDSAVKAGAHAGKLIKAIAPKVGGGGGGRPNMAQAGGSDPSGIKEALDEAKVVLQGQIQS